MSVVFNMIIERLWSMSIQASILIVVVLLLRVALRNCWKMYSYCLWLLVLVRLLCPVFIESNLSLQPDIQLSVKTETDMTTQDITQTENVIVNNVTYPAAPIVNTDEMDKAIDSNEKNLELKKDNNDILLYLQIAYLVGVFCFAIYFLAEYLRMKIRVKLAIRDNGNVWLCEQINSPFVMGVLTPKIYLPIHISDDEKRHILRHERAHIAHHDPLVRLLGSFAIILHWWNPLVWYGIHKMNQDMEMFCDETALRNATLLEKKEYSKSLLQFSMKQSGIAVTLSFGESNTELRIKNILQRKRTGILIGIGVSVIAIVCVVTFLTIPKNEEENENSVNTEEVSSQEAETTSQQEEQNNTDATQTVFPDVSIYGDWLVNHIAGSTRVTALSEEEQKSFYETRICYAENSYEYYNNQVLLSEQANVTGYNSEYITRKAFTEMFPGVSFADLAVDMDEMLYVTVTFEDNNSRFGDHFFVYDETDIIVFYEGVFFWTQKIDDLGIARSEGEYYYEIATGFKKSTVEAFASEIKSQVLNGNWTGISEKISYPITIAGTTCQNANEFLALDMENLVPMEFLQTIEAEDCEYMFCNWQGIMMGETGEIWFAEILNDAYESQGLKIIAINIPEKVTVSYESEAWYSAYQTILNDWTIIESYGDFSYLKMYFDDEYSFDNYWLCDVDSNGVPELFLHSDYMGLTAVFTYYNNDIQFLTYDDFYGINKETSELVIFGHWHGAGGSGDNEWKAFKVTKNQAVYALYIDYYEVEGLEKPYTIYTLDNQEYDKQENGEEYNELYAIHVEPCISIKNYKHYDLDNISGLNHIQ